MIIGKTKNDKELSAFEVTKDHHPGDPKEKERIEKLGGEIRQDCESGHPRVYWHDSFVPGLAMTRAIGDIVCQSLGVIAEPDIQLIELNSADKFLMLCSDGVWEFISSDQAISHFKSEEISLETKVKRLVEASINQWLEKEKDVSDDITAIVYYFK